MDLSMVLSVGSFAMSERVLKPKATVLVILGCVLAYDLTAKTHDSTSLRIYRGPAMLAFSLMMCAYSLRTWRRNGVACDELLFLPGTAHGQNHGIEGPLIEQPPTEPLPPPVPPGNRTTPKKQKRKLNTKKKKSKQSPQQQQQHLEQHHHQLQLQQSPSSSSNDLEIELAELGSSSNSSRNNNNNRSKKASGISGGGANEGDVAAGGGGGSGAFCGNSSQSSIRHRTSLDTSFDSSILETPSSEDNQDMVSLLPMTTHSNSSSTDHLHGSDGTFTLDYIAPEKKEQNQNNNNSKNNNTTNNNSDGGGGGGGGDTNNNTNNDDTTMDDSEALLGAASDAVHRFGENHPRIVRIGTFFFFRSPTSTTQNAAYAPSGPSVFGAGLDLSMPILFNFHLFIEACNHLEESGEATAKILPIIFLSVLIVRTVVPPGRRGRFWSTLNFTFTAPMHSVRIRDAFVGDVLTSLVRPGQDVLFALSYYCTVIYGTVTGQYGLERSGVLLEESRLLHNVILPSCAILPLWWKYLQTLRQAYDNNRRWPYQGNSLKYLLSTLVVIYGMTHPEDRRSPWWVLAFCFTLGYQVWWDVVMDWELFEIQRGGQFVDAEHDSSWCSRISSCRPNSHVLLRLQMYVLQPLLDLYQRLRASTPSWRQIQIRQKRLYKTEAFYWKIFAFNLCMRFTWMLCFIPAYHFSDAGEKKVLTSSSDTNSYLGVLLPVAEILRRCFWGFLALEKETIKMMESDVMYAPIEICSDDEGDQDDEEGEEEEDDSKVNERSSFRVHLLPTWLDTQQQIGHDAATANVKHRSVVMRQLFVAELCGWAAAFVILGCWAAS